MPVQTFERLFDDEVVKLIVDQSNLYASQNNNPSFVLAEEELKIFIGILLRSGCYKLPREPVYWSNDADLLVKLVATAISRNRFQEIKQNLNLLNTNFQQWGVFHENLSIDEGMVKYFGHHSSKQFIRGKPVRFGFKDWMLCSSSGYCYNFDTYCGVKRNRDKYPALPLGSKVVLSLLESVEQPSDNHVYFDNFFSSYDLLTSLKCLLERYRH